MRVVWPNFEKRGGLITVVVQKSHGMDVLMVAYTDEEGFRKTLATGLASFYSTSRKKSWVKGEESGNFMEVQEVLVDCDGDAVVYLVEPKGHGRACHTDAFSCFYRSVTGKHDDDPAPKAGPAEELPFMEVEDVHPRLRPGTR